MFYTIYKITNKVNGKIYIGKHQTKDLNDGYMGSGKHLKRSIEKYGIENFEKEILFQFDTEDDMNTKEAELVTEDFVKEDTNYNLCPGGKGGWGYVNSTGLRDKGHDRKMYSKVSQTLKNKPKEVHNHPNKIKAIKELHRSGKVNYNTFKGKNHSKETKEKISLSRKGKCTGKENSQYDTRWITNGRQNKKVKNEECLPFGWWYGVTSGPPDIKHTVEMCKACVQNENDLYYWNMFNESGMSVTTFVKEVYPYNRASFYNMKSRIFG